MKKTVSDEKDEKRPFLSQEKDAPDRLRILIGDESIRSFARRCGFSNGLLHAYLKGEKTPGLMHALAIARAAGVSLDWLATGQNPQPERDGGDLSVSASPATPSPAAPELPPEEAELLALFHSLPAAEKKKALALLRVLGAG